MPVRFAYQQAIPNLGIFSPNKPKGRSGYSSGENYQALEQRGIVGFIPPHGKYKADRQDFTYDVTTDSYRQGKTLAFDRLVTDRDGNPKKRYLSKSSDCKGCPLRATCIQTTACEKRLHHTAYKAEYERMLQRLATRSGKARSRQRSATVEPVLGSLIGYYGLGKIGVRGQVGAAKVMYLAAIAYNLKKYLRYDLGKGLSQASAMVIHITNGFLYLRTFATATALIQQRSLLLVQYFLV
ncbi:DDE family transposase [Larkinella arboricola]|uniref:DDE family transposase n=1 Tax=Larkinella arboricola TaxID=643671 RepID=A0A327WDV2_LARAB|nr:transposase [Larkinella arboricola]RAJ89174.1 DDE family transposase [Larkinella arboricola]